VAATLNVCAQFGKTGECSGREGVFDPLDCAIANHDYIEAHPALAQLPMALQKQRRGRGYAALFGAAYACGGTAEGLTRSRTYFCYDEQIATARNHIELADAAQEIPRDDGETLRFEKRTGAVLGQRARLTAIHAISKTD
jgi:hypothetical protein